MAELWNGRQAAAVSNALTKLHQEFNGRGARTTHTILQRDYVITFLEDMFTPVERTLVEAGDGASVQRLRAAFQRAMQERFTVAVEAILERKVIAFMSQTHIDPDLSVEIFVLAPQAPAAEA